MANRLSLGEVNALNRSSFIETFGDIAEHSRWVAAKAADLRPYESIDIMVTAFCSAIGGANRRRQHELLNAHPDLAGRAAKAGKLTPDSTSEQAGAGLDALTQQEFEEFQALNNRYLSEFGFPFILAVKGATKQTILASYRDRVTRSEVEEFETAIGEVCRIVGFRLRERIL